MKEILLVFIICFSLFACASRPKGFTYYFEDKDTGLDSLLNINGYYIAKNSKYSNVYYLLMFYHNGLVRSTLITGDIPSDKNLTSFEEFKKEFYDKVPWGIYKLDSDGVICAQFIIDKGQSGQSISLRKYKIISKNELEIIEEYYYYNGKFNNDNIVPSKAYFHPLKSKRDWRECPWLKKKWFTEISK